MPENDLTKQAQLFAALSDPTRLKLLKLLSDSQSGALCVNAMAIGLGVSQPAVSQHLRVLKNAGLITGERRGYHVHYVLEPDAVKRCQGLVSDILGKKPVATEDLCHDSQTGESLCPPDKGQGHNKN